VKVLKTDEGLLSISLHSKNEIGILMNILTVALDSLHLDEETEEPMAEVIRNTLGVYLS